MNDETSIDVGFCFYEQNLDIVKRAIESVKSHVRYIFAIDGKFEFYESVEQLSSPSVREYLTSQPNVILIDYPNRKENEKRQKYLDLAQKYMSDWLLILDADEYIKGYTNWEKAREAMAEHDGEITPQVFGVIMNEIKNVGYPRLWHRPYLIQYMKTHNFWQYQDKTIWKSSTSYPLIPHIFMDGDDKGRDKKYLEKSYEYQKRLMEYEKPYKQEYTKSAKNTSGKNTIYDIPGVPMV